MRVILYAIAFLFAASEVLAQANEFTIKPGFVIKQAPLPPQAPPVVQTPVISDWVYLGDGYSIHRDGYYYNHASGVMHSPRYNVMPAYQVPAYQVPTMYYSSPAPVFRGGFAGNCGPSG